MNIIIENTVGKAAEILSEKLIEKQRKDKQKKNEEVKKLLDKIKERNRNKSKKKKRNKTSVKFCIIHEPEVLANVHYLNPSLLSLFMNQKGFLNKGKFNSVCAKHQRHLRRHIIMSRHLHLLPYIVI